MAEQYQLFSEHAPSEASQSLAAQMRAANNTTNYDATTANKQPPNNNNKERRTNQRPRPTLLPLSTAPPPPPPSPQTSAPNGQLALAQIQEATLNIERIENNRSIKEALAEAIRVHGRKEKTLRDSTLSYSNIGIDTKDISNWIDDEWVYKLKQAPVTYWNDKLYIHCQFINAEAKHSFLASGINTKPILAEKLVPMNELGQHFKRRPIRIIINNVRPAINTSRVVEIIKNCTDFDTEITDVKDGKPHPITKTRSILLRINGHGLRMLVEKLDCEIPYADKDSHVKTKLRAKVNCKPWQCKDCYAIGMHQCEGKRCRNCANKGHLTKNCTTGTKYCGNCRKRGHRATDLHCQYYLNEIAKEIRKMDIPISMLECKQHRLNLAKCIQLK